MTDESSADRLAEAREDVIRAWADTTTYHGATFHQLLAKYEAAVREDERSRSTPTLSPSVEDDDPYPLHDAIRFLADFAEHSLNDHSCDHHGYEGVMASIMRVRNPDALIAAVRAESAHESVSA